MFLGPDADTLEEVQGFVSKNFDYFFESWLEGWSLDVESWPKRRTRKMFAEWFTVRIHTVVEDVIDAPYELLE